jgi:hypothetical protein
MKGCPPTHQRDLQGKTRSFTTPMVKEHEEPVFATRITSGRGAFWCEMEQW